jgi:hypothetical protein
VAVFIRDRKTGDIATVAIGHLTGTREQVEQNAWREAVQDKQVDPERRGDYEFILGDENPLVGSKR